LDKVLEVCNKVNVLEAIRK